MSRRSITAEVRVLRDACRALDQSSSPRMLRANLEFLVDRYLRHPSKDLPAHLREQNDPPNA